MSVIKLNVAPVNKQTVDIRLWRLLHNQRNGSCASRPTIVSKPLNFGCPAREPLNIVRGFRHSPASTADFMRKEFNMPRHPVSQHGIILLHFVLYSLHAAIGEKHLNVPYQRHRCQRIVCRGLITNSDLPPYKAKSLYNRVISCTSICSDTKCLTSSGSFTLFIYKVYFQAKSIDGKCKNKLVHHSLISLTPMQSHQNI